MLMKCQDLSYVSKISFVKLPLPTKDLGKDHLVRPPLVLPKKLKRPTITANIQHDEPSTSNATSPPNEDTSNNSKKEPKTRIIPGDL